MVLKVLYLLSHLAFLKRAYLYLLLLLCHFSPFIENRLFSSHIYPDYVFFSLYPQFLPPPFISGSTSFLCLISEQVGF